MKEKKIHINSRNKQMMIVIPRIKSKKETLKFSNDRFDAKVIIKRKK